MNGEDKINMDIFKVFTKASVESVNLETLTNHLSQLLVITLQIKGCAIFMLNPVTKELERLASFGLSTDYLSKGAVQAEKSLRLTHKGKPVIIRDVNQSESVQYPEEAKKEGIAAIFSFPVTLRGKVVGVLRLYHHEVWDISDRDVDSLLLLSENVGLAMGHTRLLNTLESIDEEVKELHRIWLHV